MSIKTQITLLALAVVFVALIFGGVFLVENFSQTMEREIASRAKAIARTVAQMEEIQQNVGKLGGEEIIQPIAERIRLATNVEYIVVMDMERKRYSHPLQEYLGKKFSGTDAGASLNNHEYISHAEGVLGPSVRAFVPIKTDEGTRQVGVAVVGILTPTLASLLHGIRFELYLSLLAGLMVGGIGAVVLARNIKKVMFNMEPNEIARLLEERIAVFQAISEGIVAIDKEMRITIMNDKAKRLMGFSGNAVGKPIKEIIPDAKLIETAEQGIEAHNEERVLRNQNNILVNRLPIRVKGEIVGAVSTFRDMTEVRRLAEELTGVKKFIEALRSQNHEHLNKLHTIAGLIQLKRYNKVLDYIFEVYEAQAEVTQFLSSRIKDYNIAGVLLGKYGRAQELKVQLKFHQDSRLKTLPRGIDTSIIVTILGNLLDNALEAVAPLPLQRRLVECGLFETEKEFIFSVEDHGPGIDPALSKKMFKKGYSTKGSQNRGIGLYLVSKYVESVGGKLEFKTCDGGGTVFKVYLPL